MQIYKIFLLEGHYFLDIQYYIYYYIYNKYIECYSVIISYIILYYKYHWQGQLTSWSPFLAKRVLCIYIRRSFRSCCSCPSRPSQSTICPISSDPFYIVSNYIKWVTKSGTRSNIRPLRIMVLFLCQASSFLFFQSMVLKLGGLTILRVRMDEKFKVRQKNQI